MLLLLYAHRDQSFLVIVVDLLIVDC